MTPYLHRRDNPICDSRYHYLVRIWRGRVSREIEPSMRNAKSEKEVIMNSNATYELHGEAGTIAGRSRRLTGQVIRLSAILLLSTAAFAQYGGGGGTVGTMGTPGSPGTSSRPSYGNGKAIGIGVGAAVAGVGAVYLMTHRASKVTGCVETADDGLRLTDDRSRRTLTLVPGAADVKAGERLELKGKIRKSAAGDQSFLVKTVAKDFGECHAQANAGATSQLNSQGR
jgi:hypothetical protein